MRTDNIDTSKASARSGRRPLVIAHRGASALAPENTLAAFRLALAMGADGVEMDVQLTADGHPVVIHDARVDRTTNGSGLVSKLTASQIARLDAGGWFDRRLAMRPRIGSAARAVARSGGGNTGRRFGGERVPTLEAVLDMLAATGFRRVYVEIKGARPLRSELLYLTVGLIRRFGLERSVTLLSFHHEMIKLAKEIAPEIHAAINIPAARGAVLSSRAFSRSAERAKADEVALHYGLATRRAVDALHRRGLRVSAWTVNRKLVMRRLVSSGVDTIITNFPNRLLAVLE